MKCTSLDQARRVAAAGARKMTGQGYTLHRTGYPYSFNISKPGGMGVYGVQVPHTMPHGTPAKGYCRCAFFAENAEWGVCKHILWAKWQDDADREREAEEAAEAEYWDRRAEQEEEARFWADEALIKQAMRAS